MDGEGISCHQALAKGEGPREVLKRRRAMSVFYDEMQDAFFETHNDLEPRFVTYGPQTGSICIAWELARNSESRALPQTY